MTPLPPLVLALQAGGGKAYVVVACRDEGGRTVVRANRWPSRAPDGALFLTWPAAFAWTAPALRFRADVEARGGWCGSLNAVLGRLGLPPARDAAALVRALLPEREGVEGEEPLARLILGALADRLAEGTGVEPRAPAPAGPVPRPALGDDLERLPDGPGVYEFQAADGRALYVGKARSLRRRVPAHFHGAGPEPEKSLRLAARADRVLVRKAGSELEAILVEHRLIRRLGPALNTQETVRRRRRGRLRDARVLLLLAAARPACSAVCLVSGDGRFHWETLPRRAAIPRGFWSAVKAFLDGGSRGGSPVDEDTPLAPADQAELAELALSWLVREGDRVTQLDLRAERAGTGLRARLRRLLAEDPACGRVEVR